MERTVLERVIATTLLIVAFACHATGQRLWARQAGALGSGGMTSVSLYCPTEASNPSGLASLERLTICASGVVPYGLTELIEASGVAAVPTKLCAVGARVTRSGNEMSHFTTFGTDVARRFGKVRVGIGYRGLMHTMRYSERGVSSFSIVGMTAQPNEHWEIGAAVRNIERRPLIYEAREIELGTTAWASVLWHAPRYFSIGVEMEKETRQDLAAHIGMSLKPTDRLRFTAGFGTTGAEMGAGVGYDWDAWGVRASVSHHERLGVSGGAAMTFHPQWP